MVNATKWLEDNKRNYTDGEKEHFLIWVKERKEGLLEEYKEKATEYYTLCFNGQRRTRDLINSLKTLETNMQRYGIDDNTIETVGRSCYDAVYGRK